MNILDNHSNKIIKNFLGVENIKFDMDDFERDIYEETHIKRGGTYRKETKSNTSFPRIISCIFTKDGVRMGIKLKTEDFIVKRKYEYFTDDVVDMGDGLIYMENKKTPLLLPYIFIGDTHKLDIGKFVSHIKSKLN